MIGPLHITFEETTQARWMYDVVRGYVSEAIVCDPRRNKLLGEGSKADKRAARKLAELLQAGLLRPVYHGHEATRQSKELVRGYETLLADTQRVMVRIKAIYRAHGIRTSGSAVYLRTIQQLGPIRCAMLVATVDTPYRFRTKRQLHLREVASFPEMTVGILVI